ncbi:HK97-gp10 family putative phage morphogenesis protein [Sphingobium yanoikuyae]|uniref:HK97-gp10 family putative phage morphogenesis protein n=1 Tax=Sphingobium yanoikuyae TaxID=13690 RepID=UPI0028A603E9|nr:HK97-gp10 family putative phage morphogenesis protein [Sphingobium yanoikuyae]
MAKPITITGDKKLAAQFRKMADQATVNRVRKVLVYAGGIVADRAQGSIMANSVSGKRHVASKPGDPPNNDTGILHGNIEVTEPSPLVVEVRSEAPYSAALEFGTSKIEARPFMGPAAIETKGEVVDAINQAIKAEIRRATQ